MPNNNIKQNNTNSICSKLIEAGKKAVIGTLAGAVITSPVLAGAGWEKNPKKPDDWAPPGWIKNYTPPPSPFSAQQQAAYDQMIDWFLYEASPIEREMTVLEYGQQMPELYSLDALASYIQAETR